jgi:hypothetical protein
VTTSAPTPPAAPAPAPGDWMKSVPWLANVGHVLGGYGVMLTAAFFMLACHSTLKPVLVTQFVLAALVLFKEYYIDLHYESGETVKSSTLDALGWCGGCILAWGEVLLAQMLA